MCICKCMCERVHACVFVCPVFECMPVCLFSSGPKAYVDRSVTQCLVYRDRLCAVTDWQCEDLCTVVGTDISRPGLCCDRVVV